MPIEQMTNAELAQAHREMLDKAWAARLENDFDMAQRYLRYVQPMNIEIARRKGWVS